MYEISSFYACLRSGGGGGGGGGGAELGSFGGGSLSSFLCLGCGSGLGKFGSGVFHGPAWDSALHFLLVALKVLGCFFQRLLHRPIPFKCTAQNLSHSL